jgi:hypothetical protein
MRPMLMWQQRGLLYSLGLLSIEHLWNGTWLGKTEEFSKNLPLNYPGIKPGPMRSKLATNRLGLIFQEHSKLRELIL